MKSEEHAFDFSPAPERVPNDVLSRLSRQIKSGLRGRFLFVNAPVVSITHRLTQLPPTRHDPLQPEAADDRLHVADVAALDPLENLRPVRDKRLEELAFVELALARRQPARKIQVDEFSRIRNHWMNTRQEKPLARRITGFLMQLALRAREFALVRIELAGGIFEQDLADRIAILPFEQYTAIVEKRQNHHGARMFDELARGVFAVR